MGSFTALNSKEGRKEGEKREEKGKRRERERKEGGKERRSGRGASAEWEEPPSDDVATAGGT